MSNPCTCCPACLNEKLGVREPDVIACKNCGDPIVLVLTRLKRVLVPIDADTFKPTKGFDPVTGHPWQDPGRHRFHWTFCQGDVSSREDDQ